MKTGLFILCLIVFSVFPAVGQVVQKGRVTEMNSGRKGVPGVEILVSGAAPAVSDGDGNFSLMFARQKAGDSFTVISIAKQGFEVVNERDINNRTLSDRQELSVVLCLRGQLEASRRKFYNIGVNLYQERYQKGVEELDKLKTENAVNQQEYTEKMARLSAEYKNAREKLEFYADKFSRMNKDELSELDRNAMALLEKGDVEGAIKLYEDSGILDRFLEKIAVRDTARMNLADYKEMLLMQVRLYRQQNDSVSAAKAEEIINKILERWPEDVDFKNMK